ncbi:hypothetical protein DFP72DRAFT_1070117 [Ephemerocybe angulata]|uniref:Uncharacterized protein n=1 Tax=Ephemerocybe angulata TaxID=980116 RepID=A0A8H6M2X3_9AGAR|nr:hypothetical protein DFP72DRAFT_1070117 [Tulosesus angulatus]
MSNIKDATWKDLGKCNNPACAYGTTCSTYFPAGGPEVANAIGEKCLCGCYGLQHEFTASSVPSAKDTPQPKASSGGSAGGSSKEIPGFESKRGLDSLRGFAKLAQERKDGHTDGDPTKKKSASAAGAFDPSADVHKEAWAKYTSSASNSRTKGKGSKGSKRRILSSPSPPLKKKVARVAKASKETPYSFSLVHDTKGVDSKSFLLPNQGLLNLYLFNGLVKTATIDSAMSPAELDGVIKSAFADIPLARVTEGAVLKNWRLLMLLSKGQGKRAALVPLPSKVGGEITVDDLSHVRISHRQAGNFKNLVFIALLASGPQIALEGLSESDENSGDSEDLRSEGSEESNERKASKEDVREIDNEDSDFHFVPSLTISDIRRSTTHMHCNISKPGRCAWWPTSLLDPYSGVVPDAKALLIELDGLSAGSWVEMSPLLSIFWKRVQNDFLPRLGFLVTLSGACKGESGSGKGGFETLWNDGFKLGPYGLEPIIELLYRVHEVLRRHVGTEWINGAQWTIIIDSLDLYGEAILHLIHHFKSFTPRSEYDPPGIQELRQALVSRVQYFADANEDDSFTIFRLNIYQHSVEDFVDCLTEDFGSATDTRLMKSEALLTGPRGIHGILSQYVDELLDELPLGWPSYYEYVEMFEIFCVALAKKIANYKKSHGKRKQESERGETAAPSEPRTRTQKHKMEEEAKSGGKNANHPSPITVSSGSSSDESDSDASIITVDSSSDGEVRFKSRQRGGAYPNVAPEFRKENLSGDSKATGRAPSGGRGLGRGHKPISSDPELIQLAKSKNLEALLRAILRLCPHPDESKRQTFKDYYNRSGGDLERIWKHMAMAYHPDKNVLISDPPMDTPIC